MEGGGRDPLGLSRVTSLITDDLLHGITTQTDRARYYSLYTWILWHIEQRERPATLEDFRAAFQRREALATLATLVDSPDSGPVGVRRMRGRATSGESAGEVDTQVQVLPSNPLGGYGQYYGGCLYSLGMTRRDERGVELISGELAQELAESFHGSVRGAPYIKGEWYRKRTVPWEVVEDSSEAFSIDSLPEAAATRERAVLMDLFFANDPVLHGRPLDLRRRRSLEHLLFLVDAYESAGWTPDFARFYLSLEYGPCYFDVLVRGNDAALPLKAPAQLVQTQAEWRLFCIHQYLTCGLEFLLVAVLRAIGNESRGLTTEEVLDQLAGRDFAMALDDLVAGASRSPARFLDGLGLKGISESEATAFMGRFPWRGGLNEESLCETEVDSPGAIAAVACGILALVYGRWRGVLAAADVLDLAHRAGRELWIGSVLPALDQWTASALSWREALKRLVTTFVLDQHERVMFEKQRLEARWLTWAEGRVVWEQDYSAYRRNSRRYAATTVLLDLGLLERSEEDALSLTKEGRMVLRVALEATP